MLSTKVTSGYRVTIPKEVREQLGLQPGQELVVSARGNVIELVPVPRLEDLRGIAKGANTEGLREKVERY